ncbi:IS66 family transposase [soil metagenome]
MGGVDAEVRIVELEARVAHLDGLVVDLIEQVAVRDARIGDLERLLDESRRSGKRQAAPFAKGEPTLEPKRPGRKRGDAHGRHNHRGIPNAEPDRVLDAPVSCCPDCGGSVDVERIADQFQVDIPEPRPTVTRFRVQIGHCTDCGRRVQGRHPDQTSDALGAAGSQVGPHAKAWAIWLHYGLGLSFAKCSSVLAQMGIDVTAGALCTAAQSTSTDLVPVHNDIVKRANDAAAVVMDETGWHVAGHNAWLWVATSRDVTVYDVGDGRGFDQACRLIGADYDGIIMRDGWAVYRRYSHATHQTCLAHLRRRCDELLVDLPAWAHGTPHQVNDILTRAFAARDLDDTARAAVAANLVERVELLADDPQVHDECRKLVRHLSREADALFTFLTHPGVDATNWRAEQAIRPAVVNRKVWGGNRTWNGARTQSRIMTVLRTATQQGVDAIEFLGRLARAPNPADIALFA